MAGHDPCGDGGASGVDCNEALSTLYTYLDGELTVERRTTIAVAPRPRAGTAATPRTSRPSSAWSSPTARARGCPSRCSSGSARSSPRRPAAPDASQLLARCRFPAPGTEVALAVSGGPDSCGLALLAAAGRLHGDPAPRGPRPARARGRGGRPRRGARATARAWASSPTPPPSRPGPNLEARARAARRDGAARRARSRATRWTTRQRPCCSTCCAARGSTGWPRWRRRPSPCSELRRHEVRELVDGAGVATVADPSNFDLSLRRNLLRARVLPELNRVAMRDLVPVLARQASMARDAASYLDDVARALVPDARDVAALRGAPAVLRRRRLRDLARGTDDAAHPPSAAEVDRMEEVVLGEAVATELSGGRRLARRRGRLRLEDA